MASRATERDGAAARGAILEEVPHDRWIPVLLIVALVGWVGVTSAQQAPAPPAPAAAPAAAEKMAEGKVLGWTRRGAAALEDGTMFTIPATVQVAWADLKPGSTVAISYVEAGQQKTARKIDIKG